MEDFKLYVMYAYVYIRKCVYMDWIRGAQENPRSLIVLGALTGKENLVLGRLKFAVCKLPGLSPEPAKPF